MEMVKFLSMKRVHSPNLISIEEIWWDDDIVNLKSSTNRNSWFISPVLQFSKIYLTSHWYSSRQVKIGNLKLTCLKTRIGSHGKTYLLFHLNWSWTGRKCTDKFSIFILPFKWNSESYISMIYFHEGTFQLTSERTLCSKPNIIYSITFLYTCAYFFSIGFLQQIKFH